MTAGGARHGMKWPIRPLGNVREHDAMTLAERIRTRILNSHSRQALVWIASDGGVVVSPEGSSTAQHANADNIVGYYQVPRRGGAVAEEWCTALAADLNAMLAQRRAA